MSLIAELIQKEAAQQLWQAEVRGLHLWTTLRPQVLMEVERRSRNWQQKATQEARLSRIRPRILSRHVSTLKRLFLPGHARYDALIFKKARNYNIYNYFYERIPQTLILEESWKNKLSETIWQNQDVALWDTLSLLASIGRRSIKLSTQENETIREFTRLVVNTYDIQESFDHYYGHINRSVTSSLVMRRLIEQYLIPLLKGSLVFLHQAYYMSKFAVITQVLHEHDIFIAEAQHGVIYDGHVAYTYPKSFTDNPEHPIHHYKPDILLTFGDFWQAQVTVPGKMHSIGYPHLSEKVAANANNQREKHVLFVSQGTTSSQLATVAEALANAYPDYHLIYKLHPEEIGLTDRYQSLRQLSNVTIIDYLSDVHTFIAQCETIVGIYSTVLFEAAAYPNRRLFIMDDDILSGDVLSKLGTAFTDTEELIAILADSSLGKSNYDTSQFWYPDWETRLNEFIKPFLSE